MMVVFLSQISAAIAGFTKITQSRYMVSEQLERMIQNYKYPFYEYGQKIDWIQSKVSNAL